jgi:hypothetical protein
MSCALFLQVSNYKHGDGNSRISDERLKIFSFRGLSDASPRPLKEPFAQPFRDSVPTRLDETSIPTLYPPQFIFKSRMLHMYVCNGMKLPTTIQRMPIKIYRTNGTNI